MRILDCQGNAVPCPRYGNVEVTDAYRPKRFARSKELLDGASGDDNNVVAGHALRLTEVHRVADPVLLALL